MKVEVMSREVIKPASLSPHDRLPLSFMDFNMPAVYVPLIFFYKLEDLADQSQDIVSRRLKSSLSKTLSRFYPLAGKIEGISINCNDEGAVFTEACTDLLLSDYLRNLDINSLKFFLPTISSGESAESWPLLSVNVSFFGSGSGVAVGVCVSHRICDAASVSTFLRAWAATAKEDSSDELSPPQFAGTAIYPPPDISVQGPVFDSISEFKAKCVTNRFVFESSKIAQLKTVAASESVPAPTRVEAIMALIWRCAARNALRSNLNVPRSSIMMQVMDFRLRIPSTDLSRNAIGNLQTAFFLKRDSSGSEMEISEIVGDFRKAKEEVNKRIKQHLECDTSTTLGLKFMGGDADLMSEFTPNTDFYGMSSCLRMRFYEVDFGWGRPAWVGYGSHAIYDDLIYVMLMDAKDGEGVEAWVGIHEQDMTTFVCHQDLLSYASLNPPVLI